MRSGCQWNKLPQRFGDDATVRRWFSRWSKDGVLEKIWAVLIEHGDELRDVEWGLRRVGQPKLQWKWQAADGRLGKARFGGPISCRILGAFPARC